jgi:SulP family sulfate permease
MIVLPAIGYDPALVTLGDKYPTIHATLFENPFSQFEWKVLFTKGIWMIAFATAVIAILETLLSGQIADGITGTKFDRRKEVLGLSIANIGSGIMGGIPATAALARTALNIKSGAKNRTSAIINSVFVAIIAVFLIGYFKYLPMVVIAAILVVVAIGMVEKKHFIHLIENQKIAFALSIVVTLVVILEDPIMGILI